MKPVHCEICYLHFEPTVLSDRFAKVFDDKYSKYCSTCSRNTFIYEGKNITYGEYEKADRAEKAEKLLKETYEQRRRQAVQHNLNQPFQKLPSSLIRDIASWLPQHDARNLAHASARTFDLRDAYSCTWELRHPGIPGANYYLYRGDQKGNYNFNYIISSGSIFTFLLNDQGKVLAFGKNDLGQFGYHNSGNTFQQVPLPKLQQNERVVAIPCGSNHSFLLTNQGNVWAIGDHHFGQLGFGDYSALSQATFQQVPLPKLQQNERVVAISCGLHYSFLLTNQGRAWAAGQNFHGQLGFGSTTKYALKRATFQQVPLPKLQQNERFVAISCGSEHSFLLTNQGKAWAAGGGNFVGQLGLRHNNNQYTFQQVPLPKLQQNERVVAISCSSEHSFLLTNQGKLWATGNNSSGQLGLGHNNDQNTFTEVIIPQLQDQKVVAISSGSSNTFLLTNKGNVWATGHNLGGGLGLGHNTNQTTFQQVPLPQLQQNERVVAISHAELYTVLLTDHGNLLAAGADFYGQLWLKHKRYKNTFTFVGGGILV